MSRLIHAVQEASWETRLSVSLISLAAFIEASDAAFAGAPHVRAHLPDFGLGGIWPFVPAALVTAAAVVWIYKLSRNPSALTKADSPPKPMTDVIGQVYRHITLKIDGFQFIKCTFEHVVFEIAGTENYAFIECKFPHPQIMTVTSQTPAIQNALGLMTALVKIGDANTLESGVTILPKRET